jgi:hypothetical protein
MGRCSQSINRCECELIERQGKESFGLCERESIVKHPEHFIEDSYISGR